jgi:hypothetical protein
MIFEQFGGMLSLCILQTPLPRSSEAFRREFMSDKGQRRLWLLDESQSMDFGSLVTNSRFTSSFSAAVTYISMFRAHSASLLSTPALLARVSAYVIAGDSLPRPTYASSAAHQTQPFPTLSRRGALSQLNHSIFCSLCRIFGECDFPWIQAPLFCFIPALRLLFNPPGFADSSASVSILMLRFFRDSKYVRDWVITMHDFSTLPCRDPFQYHLTVASNQFQTDITLLRSTKNNSLAETS